MFIESDKLTKKQLFLNLILVKKNNYFCHFKRRKRKRNTEKEPKTLSFGQWHS